MNENGYGPPKRPYPTFVPPSGPTRDALEFYGVLPQRGPNTKAYVIDVGPSQPIELSQYSLQDALERFAGTFPNALQTTTPIKYDFEPCRMPIYSGFDLEIVHPKLPNFLNYDCGFFDLEIAARHQTKLSRLFEYWELKKRSVPYGKQAVQGLQLVANALNAAFRYRRNALRMLPPEGK